MLVVFRGDDFFRGAASFLKLNHRVAANGLLLAWFGKILPREKKRNKTLSLLKEINTFTWFSVCEQRTRNKAEKNEDDEFDLQVGKENSTSSSVFVFFDQTFKSYTSKITKVT